MAPRSASSPDDGSESAQLNFPHREERRTRSVGVQRAAKANRKAFASAVYLKLLEIATSNSPSTGRTRNKLSSFVFCSTDEQIVFQHCGTHLEHKQEEHDSLYRSRNN
jgi:hypothetical protein